MKTIYADIETWMYKLLFVSFFLPPKIQTWVLILCCLWIAIHAFFHKKFLSKSELFLAVILGGGYLLYLAYLPLTPTKSMTVLSSLLERKISILILPFMVPLMFHLSTKPVFDELKWFAIGNIIHGIIVNAILAYGYIWNTESLTSHVAYRLSFESICGIHPTYYGMYICFSVAMLLFGQNVLKANRFYLFFAHLLLLLFVLLLTPKISLLILFLFYSFYFLFVLSILPVQRLLLFTASLIILLIAFIALPFFHDRIREVFLFFSKGEINAIDNSLVFRQLIYQIDLNILKDFWLLGIGPVALQQYLEVAYFNLSMITKQMIVPYNTHNEYLNQWICFGLFGFLYFVSVYIIHFLKAWNQKNILYVAFLLIIVITSFTENILSRQSGIIFSALFGAMFYFQQITLKLHHKELEPVVV